MTTAAPAGHADTRPEIVLHWVLAIILPLPVALGWYMLSVEDQPDSGRLSDLHISLGLTAAMLIALRLAWRLGHPPAVLRLEAARWQSAAAQLSHGLIYCALVVLPLSAYLGAVLGGRGVAVWGVAPADWATKSEPLKEQLFQLHSPVAWALVGLIGLHVLAALKHLLLDRDGEFERMWR